MLLEGALVTVAVDEKMTLLCQVLPGEAGMVHVVHERREKKLETALGAEGVLGGGLHAEHPSGLHNINNMTEIVKWLLVHETMHTKDERIKLLHGDVELLDHFRTLEEPAKNEAEILVRYEEWVETPLRVHAILRVRLAAPNISLVHKLVMRDGRVCLREVRHVGDTTVNGQIVELTVAKAVEEGAERCPPLARAHWWRGWERRCHFSHDAIGIFTVHLHGHHLTTSCNHPRETIVVGDAWPAASTLLVLIKGCPPGSVGRVDTGILGGEPQGEHRLAHNRLPRGLRWSRRPVAKRPDRRRRKRARCGPRGEQPLEGGSTTCPGGATVRRPP
mmetsp:Transcript_30407/g.81778  ORF Transcript_30407/g.81778 Transcript_30407/m.81778 type:complete len:332 (+) Transcript_30407:1102-2097(+)